jgi:uncharacterized membrane protein YfhO
VLHIRARVAEGQSIWVQESFDPNWRVFSGDQELTVRGDKLGFMIIDAPPGTNELRLVFPTPFENKIGRVIAVCTIAVVLVLIWHGRIRLS